MSANCTTSRRSARSLSVSAARPSSVSGKLMPFSARNLPPAGGTCVTAISMRSPSLLRDDATDLAVVEPDAVADAHVVERRRQRAVDAGRGDDAPEASRCAGWPGAGRACSSSVSPTLQRDRRGHAGQVADLESPRRSHRAAHAQLVARRGIDGPLASRRWPSDRRRSTTVSVRSRPRRSVTSSASPTRSDRGLPPSRAARRAMPAGAGSGCARRASARRAPGRRGARPASRRGLMRTKWPTGSMLPVRSFGPPRSAWIAHLRPTTCSARRRLSAMLRQRRRVVVRAVDAHQVHAGAQQVLDQARRRRPRRSAS